MNKTGGSAVSSLRLLPSVDEVLQAEQVRRVRGEAGDRRCAALARDAVEELRAQLRSDSNRTAGDGRSDLLRRAVDMVRSAWAAESGKRTRRVINATGVIIHTNLGRAPLSRAAVDALAGEASGYCTVEYDLAGGERGNRGERAEKLLCELTGAEAAIVVNNCAAAAFLVLSVFAAGTEVVISRGELVEIGGDFRVPDVLTRSGATLREVGTTNRTKIADYADAVNERTSMLLRVHPSNFKITGFTATPEISALADLARSKNIILFEDAGSGALIDLRHHGLPDEPVIADSISAGVDLVSFSGDKLLGGPQAGLIVGRGELIERLRRDPLYRALRVGKLVYAALEATLDSYARGNAENEIPVMRMLAETTESLASRSRVIAEKLRSAGSTVDVIDGNSVVGGGAAPGIQPVTSLVSIHPSGMSAAALERRLRLGDVPVIARLQDDRVLFDLRTVESGDEDLLVEAVISASLSA